MGSKAPSILVVDDNTEFAELLGTLIAEQGLTPILASSGHNALVLARLYAPAAIVVDLLLPDTTGHKLIKELSAKTPAPPIFVITGVFKGQAQLDKVRSLGRVVGWFEKPFDTRVLVEELVRIVDQPVVARGAHQAVGKVTPSFDIDILEPVEAEGIRDAGPGPSVARKLLQTASPADSLEIDVSVELDGADEALALWDVVDGATPVHAPALEGPRGPTRLVVRDDPSASGGVRLPLELDTGDLPPDEEVIGSLEVPVDARTGDLADEPLEAAPRTPVLEPAPIEPPKAPPRAVPEKEALGWLESQLPPPDLSSPGPGSGSLGLGSLTNPFLEKLRASAEPSSFTPDLVKAGLRAKMRAGNLKPATVARLLTAFHIARETGEIAFERGAERKVVYLADGRPVFARSNQDSDRLGAIAKRAFGLTQAQLDRALELARATERMIGDVLLEQRLVDEAQRPELVREQTRAIIRSLLAWSDGRYVIGFNASPEVQRAELDEHPASIVLAGIKDELELDRLRALVPDRMAPMPSPNPPYELWELPLSDSEALILLKSTGARTALELVRELAARIDEQSARATIYGLLILGVLVAGRPSAPVKHRPRAPA
ncbi:response regulator [Myxococcota bacterium]|nr:response regulator [Myxococcota bacterium]